MAYMISDLEAMRQIRTIVDRMNPDSPVATAFQRVFAAFAESPAENTSDIIVDEALRSVRMPPETVRKWEAKSSYSQK